MYVIKDLEVMIAMLVLLEPTKIKLDLRIVLHAVMTLDTLLPKKEQNHRMNVSEPVVRTVFLIVFMNVYWPLWL